MFYHDPNEYWLHNPDVMPDVDPDDAIKSGCFVGVFYIIALIVMLALCAMCSGCTTTQYVPVVETREVHHHHTDSVHTTDSIVRETTTTIMQMDSAAMAKYGIQLKAAERAWLVRTAELERQLQRIMESHADTVHERDSIPYPVEVIKEVPAQLTHKQNLLMTAGVIAIVALMAWVLTMVVKILRRFGIINV